ncbi:hypothetical protein NDU88_006421 [Pleurodeles waltl]|uniref:Uncharacterized protein n=1 Tax=Pleurodeles waltl TaxID=8319 RepID=A0AAV7QP15_PLEWA|nr:hypothetical protein NDU88_006421 [Pleurodeles waltl]
MCWEEALLPESRSRCNPDEAPGGRLRHWGRAALELRRARRGSARIPLRGNPGNASTGKAPGKTSRELGSAVIHAPFDIPRRASEKVAGAGASGKAREEKSPTPALHQLMAGIDLDMAEYAAHRERHSYVGGDRCCCLLAAKLRTQRRDICVSSILTADGLEATRDAQTAL